MLTKAFSKRKGPAELLHADPRWARLVAGFGLEPPACALRTGRSGKVDHKLASKASDHLRGGLQLPTFASMTWLPACGHPGDGGGMFLRNIGGFCV